MPSKYFDQISASIPKETKLFASNSLDIVDRIHDIMQRKSITQKKLAEKVEKTPATISNWLASGHNLTLKTISILEAALGEKIIITPSKEIDEKVAIKPAKTKYGIIGNHESDNVNKTPKRGDMKRANLYPKRLM